MSRLLYHTLITLSSKKSKMIEIHTFYEWIPFSIMFEGEQIEGLVMAMPDPVNQNPIIHDIKFYDDDLLTSQNDYDRCIDLIEMDLY